MRIDYQYNREAGLLFNTRISLLILFAITTLSIVVYSDIMTHDFIAYDDIRIIVDRIDRYDGVTIENISNIILKDFPREEPLIIRDLSYLVNAHIFGALNPQGYLIGNLILHVITSYLVYCLALSLFPRQYLAASLSALLFVIHPLLVESIAWISSRKDPLYTAFFLGALLQFHQYLKNQKQISLLFSCLFFLCSLFSKAAAISFFPAVVALRYCTNKFSDMKVIEALYFFAIVILTLFYIQWYTGVLQTFGVVKEDVNTQRDWFLWALSSCEYIKFYIEKLFFPVNLTIAYNYPAPHMIFQHPFSLFSAVIIIVSCIAAMIMALLRNHLQYLFLGLLFFCSFIPYLDLAQVKIFIADRYAYLGSAAFCILFSLVIISGCRYVVKRNRLLFTAFIALCAVYSCFYVYQARAATKVWRNTFTLWQNAYQLDSRRSDVYTGLIGQYVKIYVNNFGQPYSLEALEQARIIGEEAVRKFCRTDGTCPPQLFKVLAYLGEIYWQLKDVDKAEAFFLKSIALNPKYPESRFMFLSLLIEQGNYSLAAEQARLVEENAHPYLDQKLLKDLKTRIWPILEGTMQD